MQLRRPWPIVVALLLATSATPALAHELELDTAAAQATIGALGNSGLTQGEAHRVAELPANKQLIRKISSFGTAVTNADFERELMAAARGETPANERFNFSRLKARLPEVAAALADFEKNRASNSEWILKRVQDFSPPGPPLKLKGWIIAGGNSTGFAFGDPEFYLKIDDFVGAPDYLRTIMAHELYHAVQGAAIKASGRQEPSYDELVKLATTKAQRDAVAVRVILDQLLAEGVATYVGDPMQTTAETKFAAQERDRIRNLTRLPKRMPTLLDMALIAVTDAQPLDIEDVYSVGFYADQPLYYVGYLMAQTIAQKKGPARLGVLAIGDGCGFASDYLEVVNDRNDDAKLGERSIALIKRACATPTPKA